MAPPPGARDWMLDATAWTRAVDDYVDTMVWLVGRMLSGPKHFYRPARVNPDSPREQQLADIRRIYGPEKEALGVLAIEIELV